MTGLRRQLLLVCSTSLVACAMLYVAGDPSLPEKVRKEDRHPAQTTGDYALTPNEQEIVSILESTLLKLSRTKNIRIDVQGDDRTVHLNVYYDPNDRDPLLGYAGNTLIALRTLINEMSIEDQRAQATRLGKDFDIRARKVLYLDFFQRGGQ